jgi:hypothetical protein
VLAARAWDQNNAFVGRFGGVWHVRGATIAQTWSLGFDRAGESPSVQSLSLRCSFVLGGWSGAHSCVLAARAWGQKTLFLGVLASFWHFLGDNIANKCPMGF